ncbi:uroporphyrinogen-III synthase Ups1 [Schizosaccharomyces cryophilus OY26]|uniref:Uroporphyrinogen-III synthase n=1 Tax=Schizosaccharomyces cryophilus (strain OY26 / ATCC MYA-4695 / CBS 11777 / NBRC 106824 / NRRL Y48691) TaxID=653667 RepID=S9X8A8_SCHCR|nr:uroporphyrinogen-III synthase Ups1 [Schizosaccharomyces cryophilus OY26]EPY53312.1 uroporphyrinogen-III synthase Ups1 [Schizosaccharomyces cryophilus OY26]
MKSVLLLKTQSNPVDPYVDAFKQYQRNTFFLAVLQHQPVNESILQTRLSQLLSNYCGLIVTSQRVSETLSAALKQLDESTQNTILSSIPVFTVGPATDDSIRRLGFQQTFGRGCGRGEILADLIQVWYQSTCQSKPLLFLVGEKHRDIIPRKLGKTRIEELVVYVTQELEQSQSQVVEIIEKHPEIDWIVVFSPTQLCSQIASLSRKLATIGPTTGNYLQKLGIEPNLVSSAPNPVSLASDINEYDLNN